MTLFKPGSTYIVNKIDVMRHEAKIGGSDNASSHWESNPMVQCLAYSLVPTVNIDDLSINSQRDIDFLITFDDCSRINC